MSIESLLLVAFLIGLPLLERIVRAYRAWRLQSRNQPAAGGTDPARAGLPPTPAVTPPALPPRHRAAERRAPGRHVGASRTSPPGSVALPLPGGHLPAGRRAAMLLRQSGALRTAFTLTAILGPCKALEHDARASARE